MGPHFRCKESIQWRRILNGYLIKLSPELDRVARNFFGEGLTLENENQEIMLSGNR
jgi:hypothetical protein